MNNRINTFLFLSYLFFFSHSILAQKPYLHEEGAIYVAMKEHLDQEIEDGELKEFADKHQIKGSYTYNISIDYKGKVTTVFLMEKENAQIAHINKFSTYLKNIRFPFKVPKNRRFKYKYTFNF